jgi:hypothetical protein
MLHAKVNTDRPAGLLVADHGPGRHVPLDFDGERGTPATAVRDTVAPINRADPPANFAVSALIDS